MNVFKTFLLCGSLTCATIYALPVDVAPRSSGCQAPAKGPTGATGATGPTGAAGATGATGATGALAANYGSFYTENSSPLTVAAGASTDIPFTIDEVTAIGVIHPVLGNDRLFEIVNAGIYLVCWTLTVENSSLTTPLLSNVTLVNDTAATVFGPTPFSTITLDANSDSIISGQILISVSANTVIRLAISNPGTIDYTVLQRAISIAQVAQAP